MNESDKDVREVLRRIKPLAVDYCRLTGKPMGVLTEIAHLSAAEIFGLTLTPILKCGYDALRGKERFQIKGRVYWAGDDPGQRITGVRFEAPCDKILLVLLDNVSLETVEIWEATYSAVVDGLSRRFSDRGRITVVEFKRFARLVWPA